MSEKIFALLLRLYPAHFRARYGEESLQLLRDRLRDEPGLLARLRLWFDLLTDTAIALPRIHSMPAPALSAAAVAPSNGLPSFGVLEPQSLRPAALVLASIIGISGCGTFAILLRFAGINHASRLAQIEKRAAIERRWTNGGFLGRPLPPPPPPPSYDMLETPMDTSPPSISPHPATSASPANSTRSAPAATPAPIPGPAANNLQPGPPRELTPLIMVPVLGPETQTGPAIPLPALEKQFGILPETPSPVPANHAPSRATSAQPFAKPAGRRSIVVLNPSTERPPCPATTSETGSNSSINPASSAASARMSPPCSKSPKSPTASANPASIAAPK